MTPIHIQLTKMFIKMLKCRQNIYTFYVRRYMFRPHRSILRQHFLGNPLHCERLSIVFLMCVIIFILWDVCSSYPHIEAVLCPTEHAIARKWTIHAQQRNVSCML
jgi:hypothetical protein